MINSRARDAIEEAVSRPQWNMVADGLPIYSDQYLVSVDMTEFEQYPDWQEHQVFECAFVRGHGFVTRHTVVAWMPMPKGVS